MVKLKRRYLLAEVLADGQVDSARLYSALLEQIAHLHGDFGVGAVCGSLQVKVHDRATKTVVLRISANECHFITSALPFVLSVDRTRCVLHLLLEASSMRTIEKALIKRNVSSLYAQLKAAKTKGDRQFIQEAIRSVTGFRVAHIRI
uniref:Ribonuclease P/MRP protein subunit POP5 n=1 Tax=Globodera rostochiensis TaxID=31243 RepID=A0A914HB85_GLORO